MNSLIKRALWLAILTLLVACAQQPIQGTASPYYQIPVGSRIVLHQPLEIKPGHTRMFVQRGEVTDFSDLDQYWPSCSFVVRDLKQEPQQIVPDSFVVLQVQQGETQIVGKPHLSIAALNLFSDWGGGKPLVARYYDHWLSSDQQPNVLRMRCFGVMADLEDVRLPLYDDIEMALGSLATIEP